MPIILQTLFTTPQDVWDLLSTEGVDLREDDHNLASGQIIQTTSDTPVGSTSMSISPLSVVLLNGAQLTFDSANMPVPIIISLTAVANIGATSLSIALTVTDVPSGAQARDSGVNAVTGARLLVGTRKGTSKVKLYCNQRYDDTQLKLSGTVLDWATICAAKFLCTRRAQGCPTGIKAEYDEAIEEMRMVQVGQLAIEDIGTRNVDWPSVTNITVDVGYDFMRARVEPNISEQTPTAYNQYVDWNSAAAFEY
jgi:hypothetical protein